MRAFFFGSGETLWENEASQISKGENWESNRTGAVVKETIFNGVE